MNKNYHPTMYDPSYHVGDILYYEDKHTDGLTKMKIIKRDYGFVTLGKC